MPCHPSPCRGLAMKPVVVGITGASGSVLARSAVDELLRRDLPTTVVCSNAARIVWQDEMEAPFNDTLAEWREHPRFTYYPIGDLRSPLASGTYPTRGMVIVPCSMKQHRRHRQRDIKQPAAPGRGCLSERETPAGPGTPGNTTTRHPLGEHDDPGPHGRGGAAAGASLLPQAPQHRRYSAFCGRAR